MPGSSARTVRSVHKQGNCHVELAPRKRWVVRSPEHPMAHNRVFQAAGVEAVRALCSPSRGVGIGPTSGPSGQLPSPNGVATDEELGTAARLMSFNRKPNPLGRANPSKTGRRAEKKGREMATLTDIRRPLKNENLHEAVSYQRHTTKMCLNLQPCKISACGDF